MSFMDFTVSKLTSFEAREFDLEAFSVDEFIQRKRYSVPLDVLRDDLGAHLKFLRSSLIELINQDYGHFVNLSSNLVGLDGRIQSITAPLTRTQLDLEKLENTLANTLCILSAELARKKQISLARSYLQFLRFSSTSLESAEKSLLKIPSDVQTSSDFNSLKTACDKVAETKVLLRKCQASPLLNDLNARWNSCCKTLLQKLEALLTSYASAVVVSIKSSGHPESSLTDDTREVVQCLLSMFAQLECQSAAETIFTQQVVKPYCDEVLSRKGNFTALLEQLQHFIRVTPLVLVSQALGHLPWMQNYDFISRGLFPHVCRILSQQFPHIWSPSTPDSFHSNWKRVERFLECLEAAMPSTVHLHNFRASREYEDLVGKWQFNVYFQLRFHSLAVELESALESFHSPCSTNEFRLEVTRVLIKVLDQCWDEKSVFLWELSGRFLKASALFISRYLKEIRTQVIASPGVDMTQLKNAAWDLNKSEQVLRCFLKSKVEQLRVRAAEESEEFEKQSQAFLSTFSWTRIKGDLEIKLVELTASQSTANMAAVREVPRLFRRTNREISNKQSDYLSGILAPIQALAADEDLGQSGDSSLLLRVCDQVMSRYVSEVEAVLTSVQRMEESLKRLKKVKGQSKGTTSGADRSAAFSDDDKIRRQIQIDVQYFVAQVKGICPMIDTAVAEKLFEK